MLASCIFYSLLEVWYLFLLLITVLIDYMIAIFIGSERMATKKKCALVLSIVLNLSLLFGFKYLNLFGASAGSLLGWSGITVTIPGFHLIAPVGISFFTFKKMSYVIDVYRGTIKPERNFGIFALYVSLFLEILSGPIDRAGNLIPQLRQPQALNGTNISGGILLILWGLFMKVVVADRLAMYTDAIFNNVGHHHGPSLLLASYFYTFQIYCDFAGYTNMAIGCGKLFGVDLMQNFNHPYFSTNISDFWRRWHISLSQWFRDYVYIPLGGKRVTVLRRCLNLMAVFLLCGLWHGASWTFVVWGGIHGLFLSIGFLTKDYRERGYFALHIGEKTKTVIQTIISFHLIAFAWIFFRANSLDDALYFVLHLFSGWPDLFVDFNSMAYGILGVLIIACVELAMVMKSLSFEKFDALPIGWRWACYYALFFLIILTGIDSESSFIYFQF